MEPNHNDGILLQEGRLSIRYGDKAQDCLCRVTFDLTRKFHVVIDCLDSIHELLGGPLWFQSGRKFQVLVPGTTNPLDCEIHGSVRQQIGGDDPHVYPSLMVLGSSTLLDHGVQLYKASGAIPNFAVRHFPPSASILLTGGTWQFELIPVGDSRLVYPARIQNDSYQISHHLLLQRNDGAAFSSASARETLYALSTFLSFCAEQWIAPVLVTGFDQSGRASMQEWGTARIDSGTGNSGWLDEHHPAVISEIFPGFSNLVKDDEWRTTIRTSVYWYVRSDTNRVGPDGAIVLVQAALERLAWHILVKVRHAISEDGFSRLAAADQLRLVLNACSIPSEPPGVLLELTSAAKAENWADGPEAFVAVRNQIVHPAKRQKVKGGRAFFEALQLGKWYLELILLKSFGFNGNYACRLNIPRWAGSVEPVPWAKATI